MNESTRRRFLTGLGLTAGAPLALPGFSQAAAYRALLGVNPEVAGRAPSPFGPQTEHVVIVAFAGGVRKKEVLEAADNAPNLNAIGRSGVIAPRVACQNLGHYGAALSIFTGHHEAMGIRDNERGLNPTLFELLRKDMSLGPADIWLSTSSGAQGRLFAHSDHPEYGADFAANVLDGDGLFNVEFKRLLESFGKPKVDSDQERAVLRELGDAMRPVEGGTSLDPDQLRGISNFVLDQLTGNTARITGPGSGDAKAIRVGANILKNFRPRLLGITLQNHDAAHGSFNGYVEIIRRNDEEIGKLWEMVQQDDALRDKTALLVLPEFGRDKDLNERNGLDHGDQSKELHEVFLIAKGPDMPTGRVISESISTIDVAPTVYQLLSGQRPPRTEGRVLRSLLR
ncbi:MAG: hypothetical protein AAF196_04595 [Planctomycetota bacterium]